MSASLIVVIPVALLGVVMTLCFVGCFLDSGPYPGSPYRIAILNEANLVAFWPLNDAAPSDTSQPVAADIASHPAGIAPFNGKYTGTFMLQQPGIVVGDIPPGAQSLCASFNGGRVEIPFHDELNEAPFTLECWVQRAWADSDATVHSVVVTTDLTPTANSGYALFCDETNMWNASIGLGSAASPAFKETTPAASSQAAAQGVTTYLALTFDGTVLNLFVNPIGTPFNTTPYAQLTLAVGDKFAPSSGMLQLFIGMGRPDMPTSMLLPFNGKIQDVAFYNTLLGTQALKSHFDVGKGG